MTGAQLGDTTYDPPPPELPQQSLDEGALPENQQIDVVLECAAALKRRGAPSLNINNSLEKKELAAGARELAITGLEISRRHFWQVQWMHRAARAEAAATASRP